jgi:hypothetical protein
LVSFQVYQGKEFQRAWRTVLIRLSFSFLFSMMSGYFGPFEKNQDVVPVNEALFYVSLECY